MLRCAVSDLLKTAGAVSVGFLSVADCRIRIPRLLPLWAKTVIPFAVPYYCDSPQRNISVYAIPRDYHLFFRSLFSELEASLDEIFPDFHWKGFADHSPIDEVGAAAKAGLGVIGKNRLLLHPVYGSYVFLGELYTDAAIPSEALDEPFYCEDCGRCRKECPSPAHCLSAVTQQKASLSDEEKNVLRAHGCAWGCDRCQEVCPHNYHVPQTPIPFFKESRVSFLTSAAVRSMSDKDFSERAYAWRGRAIIERNLRIIEENDEEKLIRK